MLFKGDDLFVPYMTLNNFVGLYQDIALKGTIFDIENNENNFKLSITKDSYSFDFDLNYSDKKVTIEGACSACFASKNKYENSSLSLGLNDSFKLIDGNDESYTLDLYEEGDAILIIEGEKYLPFSFLSVLFSSITERTFYFNYKDVFLYEETDDYEEISYYASTSSRRQTNPRDEQLSIITENIDTWTPLYIKEDQYNAYSFLLRNYFGLGSIQNFDIDEVFTQYKFKETMTVNLSSQERLSRMNELFAFFDDNHTAFYDSLWNTVHIGRQYTFTASGEKAALGSYEANTVLRGLSTYGLPKDGTVAYSTNGETAYFLFNSFSNIAFDIEENIKADDPVLTNGDDAFKLRNTFKKIQNKGGVKNIIIDISLNGGGYVGNLEKVLCLLAKDKTKPLAYFKDNMTNSVYSLEMTFDSNLNGVIDEDDYFGDDFNIFIMTSAYTFSCANALAFYSQKLGLATLIGTTSGGGECTVNDAMIPTGERIYYSGPLRIGYYENGQYIGDQAGGPVASKYTLRVNDANRYRVDYLDTFVRS